MSVLPFLALLALAGVVYVACELFVNGVEHLGARLRLGGLAVGTVLAAAGTALPESVITLVAVAVRGGPDGAEIGIGAAMGGPLALATVAYGAIGLALWREQRHAGSPAPALDLGQVARDQRTFLVLFAAKAGLGLVAFAWKPWLGGLFLLAYAAYVVRELRAGREEHDEAEEFEPLTFQRRRAVPSGWAVWGQVAVALAVVVVASQLFVDRLVTVAPVLGLPASVTALLLAPVASELPEVLNGVLWVRAGKPRLALAAVSGSMIVQVTVPSAFGLFWTPWEFAPAVTAAAVTTAAALAWVLVLHARGGLTAGRLALAPLALLPLGALLPALV